MNCLDARRLLRQGDDAPEPDRDAALEHLDRCSECGALGPALDPLLLFRHLPELGVSSAETARMREAVGMLRRAPVEPPAPRAAGVALRLAAAMAAACALWLAPGPLHRDPVIAPGVPVARLAGAVPLPEYLPSVETVGGGDVYVATQVNDADLTLVILANVDVTGR